jgi:hypothetical protein
MNQLFFARTEILKKVNAYMGKSWAGQIRFTMDARDLPADSKLPEDPTAQKLLEEHLTQMTFQNVTQEEARMILEHFRKKDGAK